MYSEALNIKPKSETKSSVAGYCSLEPKFFGASEGDHALLNEFCLSLNGNSEIFAEEISSEAGNRPMWTALLRDLDCSVHTEVVVPSLFHIAGTNIKKAREFFKFTQACGVRVRCLREQFDTDEDSVEAMLAHLPTVH
jgi:hypothetical protein